MYDEKLIGNNVNNCKNLQKIVNQKFGKGPKRDDDFNIF